MPFQKGHQQFGCKPKKSELWKDAEKEIREALPRLLRMPRSLLKTFLKKGDPTGAELAAYAYMTKFPVAVMERFLPNAWHDEPNEMKVVSVDQLREIVAEQRHSDLTNGHINA